MTSFQSRVLNASSDEDIGLQTAKDYPDGQYQFPGYPAKIRQYLALRTLILVTLRLLEMTLMSQIPTLKVDGEQYRLSCCYR